MSTGEKPGLAYLDFEIERCVRRIKKIRDNPDPSKPQSNIMLYELERDFRMEQKQAVEEGKPIGVASIGGLTRALGMVPWDAIMAADRTFGEPATRYFDIIRKEGMPEHTCDRCSILIPMLLKGDFPRPSFVGISNFECIPIFLAHVIVSQLLNIPSFNVDRNFKHYSQRGKEDDELLKYGTDQLREMIDYVEANVPGCKYDEDKLVELQHYDRQFLQEFQRLWKLKAAVPCPLSGRESFREIRLASMYTDPKKAVEYMHKYVDEVGERVEKGLGAAQPEERLRFLWSVAGPFYADPFSWLERKGVSIPAAEMTIYNGWFSGREPIWGDPWKGRKLTPLEDEVRQADWVWGRLGDKWVQTHLDSCRDLHIDGLVYFQQWGCPVTNNLGKVVADVVEKELDIPTVFVEGRMLESSIYNDEDFHSRLEDFVEVCLATKESRVRHS